MPKRQINIGEHTRSDGSKVTSHTRTVDVPEPQSSMAMDGASTATADPFAEQAEKERQLSREAYKRESDSFERSDTDGFLSQWANNITGKKHALAADIAENGGKWTFPALYRRGEDGEPAERVRAKLINGRYGPSWAICGKDGQFTGDFISAFPKRESTMAKKGFVEGDEEADAYADTYAPPGATGLSGATQVSVIAKRRDHGYPEGAVQTDKQGNVIPDPEESV